LLIKHREKHNDRKKLDCHNQQAQTINRLMILHSVNDFNVRHQQTRMVSTHIH